VSDAPVELRDVGVRFGSRWALRKIRLAPRAGETLAVLGPNGAGKTTLLRVMLGLVAPDEGEVARAGEGLSALREVAWVPQRSALLRRSSLENVALPLRLRGVPRREARARAADALARVGIGHLAERRATTLSGGEAQRLAFARATVASPRLLLLDEFTANLDPPNVRALEALAREERARGAAVVVVTHNFFEARRLADRALVLVDGAPAALGATREVFEASEGAARAFLTGEMVW
jgi:tungstate transport system ATP-binding protein